jgi:hypothetical protein
MAAEAAVAGGKRPSKVLSSKILPVLPRDPASKIREELGRLAFDPVVEGSRHVDLSNAHGRLRFLKDARSVRDIVSLSLHQQNLTDEDVIELLALPNLKNLRWLGLAFNPITEVGVEALMRSPLSDQLEFVNLTGNTFDPRIEIARDQGYVVDRWFTPEAQSFIARVGKHPRWLDRREPVDRFAIG